MQYRRWSGFGGIRCAITSKIEFSYKLMKGSALKFSDYHER
jgi:hypothetical protein